MNLKEWRETSQHGNHCAAHNEGQWCCLDYIPDEIAEHLNIKFEKTGPGVMDKPRLTLSPTVDLLDVKLRVSGIGGGSGGSFQPNAADADEKAKR